MLKLQNTGVKVLLTKTLTKAHPAISVENLDGLIEHLTKEQIAYQADNRFHDTKRIHILDPFGNRLEFIEKQ